MANNIAARSKKRALSVFVGCCLMQMVGLGSVLNSSSAFFAVVPGSVGLGMGEFALWLTTYGIGALIALPIVGNLISKIGAKIVISAAVIVSAICVFLFSFATEVWHFGAIGVVIGLSGGMYFLYACPVLINAWFVKKRGLFLGVANAFSGIGGAIWPIVFTALFPIIGYQNVYTLNAVLILVLILPFSLTVFTTRPESVGLQPYGIEETGLEDQDSHMAPASGVPIAKAAKSIAFVCMLIACGLCAFYGGYNSYMQSFVVFELGDSFLLFSATMMTALQLGYIIATPVCGALVDKFGPKPVSVGLIILMIVAFLGFMFVRQPALLLVLAFVFGTNNTLVTISVPTYVRELFGSKDYEKILSYAMMAVGVVGAVGAMIIGSLFDATGTYSTGFIVGSVVGVVIIIFMFLGALSSRKLTWEE